MAAFDGHDVILRSMRALRADIRIVSEMTSRIAVAVAALLLLLGVAAGAFGAHALRARLAPEQLAIFQTAVQYQFWHALGLLAIGVLLRTSPGDRWLGAAAWLLVAGVVLFCGSLYIIVLAGVRTLGVVTPIGGVAFLAGWAALAASTLRRRAAEVPADPAGGGRATIAAQQGRGG
jgi:uncharacterized membrane protein YgdD (TMEM256/DUF423 family)